MRWSLLLKETRMALTSIPRNTSWNKGWLPLVVHAIFGTLIVASFILIMLLTVGNISNKPGQSSRCNIKYCTVKCNKAPYYGDFEDDIVNAVSEAATLCKSVALVLTKPNFKDSRMPVNFLSRLRSNIQELAIEGGNLKYITSHAFMSPYSNNLKSLFLENVEIMSWKDDTLVGLSDLKKLVIKGTLRDIKENALQAVDDTIEILDIKAKLLWNPINITGSADPIKLHTVDLSLNIFYNILNNETFTTLRHCKILYLNSCNITFLGPGTFDNLDNLELLYLNNNYLVTIPSGLFYKISSQPIRIALHDNFWFCDCSRDDIRSLYKQGILIIDPICHYPDDINGLTLAEFDKHCSNYVFLDTKYSFSSKALQTYTCNFTPEVIQINKLCSNKNDLTKSIFPQIPPELKHVCSSNRISSDILKQINNKNEINIGKSDWLMPVFSIQNSDYTMIKIAISGFHGSGLLWYQTTCEDTVYCMNVLPEIIKLYSVSADLDYTFCPYNVTSGIIETLHCVSYNLTGFEKEYMIWYETRKYILLICGSLGCIICGATCVYALIQRNPNLLKGNKRVVLVKHKTFDAIILPPEIPTRKNILQEADTDELKNKNIFMLPQSNSSLSPKDFTRSISTRSSESNDASYVSALQPTDEQLFEWRCDQNVNNLTLAATSDRSISPSSTIDLPIPYYSLKSNSNIYETVK